MIRPVPVVLALLLSACGSGPDAPAGRAAETPAASAPVPREMRVPADLQKAWGVTTGPVQRLSLAGALRIPGVLALDQKRSAHVSAILEGKVVSVSADLGDAVKRGEVLVVLHSPAFAQAQSAFLQAGSRRRIARREFERAAELLASESIQQKEYQRRKADDEAAATEFALAESTLHSLGWDHPQIDALVERASKSAADASDLVDPYLRVRSPVAGRVVVRDVVLGEHVPPDKLLFAVSDLSVLWALLDAREQDLPALASAEGVSVESQVYPGRSFDGRLTRVGDIVDEKLRTITLRVEVPNPGLLLKPNMYVQGLVRTRGPGRQALGVPEAAIQTIDGEPSVFVLAGGAAFTVRAVEPGERVGTSRTITKGLDGSEIVALAGAFNLKAEWLKASFAGE